MKLRDVFNLDGALNALDVIDQSTGLALYAFKGAVRMSLTRKMRVVKDAVKDYQQTRKKMEAELGIKPDTKEKDPALWSRFDLALGEILDAEVDIELGTKLKYEDLDVDRNSKIPNGLILMLSPWVLDLPA